MTLFDLASRYIGIHEIAGSMAHPLISWWHSLCGFRLDTPDEVPWCSSFLNGMAWELRLPRSKSAAARSWLGVGTPVNPDFAVKGDIVILQRGTGPQPGPEVLQAPGHVGIFAGWDGDSRVFVLGGNQSDQVSVASYAKSRILGLRRLT